MKKITLCIFLMITSLGFSQTNPINFEVGGNGANWTWNTFENPSTPCAPLQIIPNPDISGINTSATVASYTPLIGAPFYAGTETAHGSPLGTFTLTASNSTVKIMVWKPVISNVGIKFATLSGASTGEINVPNTVINQWEELTFNFASKIGEASSTDIENIVVFIDSQNNRTSDNTCYFDNITFSQQVLTPPGPVLPLDFESPTLDYTFTDFEGGGTTKISNPQVTGINTSANVAQMIKSLGAVYGGSFIVLDQPIDFTVNKIFKVKVFSPRASTKLLLKVENPAGNFEVESTTSSAGANTWEEMTFDYSAIPANLFTVCKKLVFIFDLGTQGDGTANFTFLFDDVRLVSGTGSTLTQMNLPVTFDDSTVDYGLVSFAGNTSTIETDPTLPTNKLAKIVRSNTAEVYAGTTITAPAQLGFSSPIPFTATNKKMNVRVWSPSVGVPIRLKVEVHGVPTQSVETETLTNAVGWQVLEFNFANEVSGTAAFNAAFSYDKATIFFNFGTTGAIAGEQIYYFDDVNFGGNLAVSTFDTHQVSIYPNPATDKVTIQASNTIQKIIVYNFLGQEIMVKTPYADVLSLDVSGFQSGTYFVKTILTGTTSTFRIIKK